MSMRQVHWHEGMFLRPHHLQASDRYWDAVRQRDVFWSQHHGWGVRRLEIDRDALSNFRLVVRQLHARMRDGAMIAAPENGPLTPLDLKLGFARATTLLAYVGVPILDLGKANASDGEASRQARFLVGSQDIEDENTGLNPRPVPTRSLNLRLLLSTDDHTGFEVLPIARLVKSPRAEATPELDVGYFPPLLACDAFEPMAVGVLEALYDRIGKKIELLANQVTSRGITFDSHSQGDALILAQLRQLNEAQAVLGMLRRLEGVHPSIVYLELCRMVGQLAIFGSARRPPELPRYDHDELGDCFHHVKQHIDALLNIFVEPDYKERAFIGAGLRMQVALEPAWLESVWELFVGVQSPLESEDLIRLLTKPGQLDAKIASSDRVDQVFRMGLAGLKFTYVNRPPRALPSQPGLAYFQLSRETALTEWHYVQKSLSLAIRLNENLISGNIQGERTITINNSGQMTTLQFTLYMVPADKL